MFCISLDAWKILTAAVIETKLARTGHNNSGVRHQVAVCACGRYHILSIRAAT